MTDLTTTWLLRLRALTVAERPALVDEMSEGEAKMCLLRLEVENERLREALKWFDGTKSLLGDGR